MTISSFGDIFRLLREIDLGAIRDEAERPVALLLTGEPALAGRVADLLSATPGREGRHPWLVVGTPDPGRPPMGRYAAALHVTALAGAPAGADVVPRGAAGIPWIGVGVGEGPPWPVGAELPRPGETVRLLLPADFTAVTLQTRLLPVLFAQIEEGQALALARQLPLLRGPLIQQLIDEGARANAIYATTTGLAEIIPVLNIPLTAADILVLTKNQLVMAFKIALAAGREGTPRSLLVDIVGVVGGGFFFRQIARELVGLIPVFGIVPKVAVAFGGTWVIGRTVALWAQSGERLSPEDVRRFYAEALERGQQVAEQLLARRRRELPLLPDPEPERPGALTRLRRRLPFGRDNGGNPGT